MYHTRKLDTDLMIGTWGLSFLNVDYKQNIVATEVIPALHGSVTSLLWTSRKSPVNMLVAGTEMGWLMLYVVQNKVNDLVEYAGHLQ
jgi:hypothetical protein